MTTKTWFDTHVEVIGINDEMTDTLTTKLKTAIDKGWPDTVSESDSTWQVGYYVLPHSERSSVQDHTPELYFFDKESDAQAYCESVFSRGCHDVTLTSPQMEDMWTLSDDGWS